MCNIARALTESHSWLYHSFHTRNVPSFAQIYRFVLEYLLCVVALYLI